MPPGGQLNPAVLSRVRRALPFALWGTAAGVVTLLALAAWPEWWRLVAPERSPMTWFESLLLFCCFAAALVASLLRHLAGDRRTGRWWLVLAAGFLCLTLDERFALHERLRDGLLAPRGIDLPVFFWTSPGDYMLLLVLLAGLVLLPRFLRLFAAQSRARWLFIAAVGVSALAVGLDSLNFHAWSVDTLRAEQFIEECLETAGMLLFLHALLLVNLHELEGLAAQRAA